MNSSHWSGFKFVEKLVKSQLGQLNFKFSTRFFDLSFKMDSSRSHRGREKFSSHFFSLYFLFRTLASSVEQSLRLINSSWSSWNVWTRSVTFFLPCFRHTSKLFLNFSFLVNSIYPLSKAGKSIECERRSQMKISVQSKKSQRVPRVMWVKRSRPSAPATVWKQLQLWSEIVSRLHRISISKLKMAIWRRS